MATTNSALPPSQNYHVVGGSLIIPSQPNVMTYALRQDQFETLCDGEMSVSRSIRDACIGAIATGVTGLAGILLTVDWDLAEKQGRHPVPWVIAMCSLILVAVVYSIAESIKMWRTQTSSAYSRLVGALKQYFGLT